MLPTPESKIEGDFDFIIDYPISPEDWFLWITHSSGYIGMRFHPIIVSLFNGVPFIAFDHYVKKYFKFLRIQQSSKTYDLCLRYGVLNNWKDLKNELSTPVSILENLLAQKPDKNLIRKSKPVFVNSLKRIVGI
ncbi:MAG: polysaccharide pyruvyl transferase family protein [Cyclobacteriaceae bacterium]|nr:polysaccharide pyruvyl transferase family protein [Cyclobacteriaceae bacterium]